jgi:hypothetical protein
LTYIFKINFQTSINHLSDVSKAAAFKILQ